MATNFVQPGDVITVAAPSGGVTSGAGVLIGSLFGVAMATAAQGVPVAIKTEGVFELPKATGAGTGSPVGQLIYWDSANARTTETATSNMLIGVAVAVSGDSDTLVKVRLNGAARAAEPS